MTLFRLVCGRSPVSRPVGRGSGRCATGRQGSRQPLPPPCRVTVPYYVASGGRSPRAALAGRGADRDSGRDRPSRGRWSGSRACPAGFGPARCRSCVMRSPTRRRARRRRRRNRRRLRRTRRRRPILLHRRRRGGARTAVRRRRSRPRSPTAASPARLWSGGPVLRAGSRPGMTPRSASSLLRQPPEVPPGDAMRQLMIGTWEFETDFGEGMVTSSTLEYRPDMTFSGFVTITMSGDRARPPIRSPAAGR